MAEIFKHISLAFVLAPDSQAQVDLQHRSGSFTLQTNFMIMIIVEWKVLKQERIGTDCGVYNSACESLSVQMEPTLMRAISSKTTDGELI